MSSEQLPKVPASARPDQSKPIQELPPVAAITVADLDREFPVLAQRISRGHGLVLFAALQNLRQAWCRSKPDLRFELIGYENKQDRIGKVLGESGGSFYGGEQFGVRVTNPGKLTVSASLVVIHPQYDITGIEFSQRASQTQDKSGGADQSGRIPIRLVGLELVRGTEQDWVVLKPGGVATSERLSLPIATAGLYHVVAVADLQSSGQTSFGFLGGASLDVIRKGRGDRQRRNLHALSTPLGKLFQTILYSEGETTGLPVGELGEFSMPRASFLLVGPADPLAEG